MKPKHRRTLEKYSDIVKTYMVDPLLAKDLIAVCVSSSNKFSIFPQEVQRYNMCYQLNPQLTWIFVPMTSGIINFFLYITQGFN